MTPAEVVDAFEAGRVAAFGHAQHVELAWSYLQILPSAAARARFSTALQRFAASISKPDLYKEKLTLAWFDAIEARLRPGGGGTFADFAAACPELFRPGLVQTL